MMKKLRFCLLAVAASAALLCVGHAANAADLYSFETVFAAGGPPGPDGYFGLGAGATQDTIGATVGDYSMKYQAGTAGFVGARTEFVPAAVNNPPGVKSIVFDMYVPEIPAAITFADIGITMFGHDLDNGIFGIQMQFADTVSIASLGVGQHYDLSIDLDLDVFTNLSFNEIFGDDVTDLDVSSAFQFYISKNAGAGTVLTVYIDNVRTVVPEPTTAVMFGLAGVMGLVVRRQR